MYGPRCKWTRLPGLHFCVHEQQYPTWRWKQEKWQEDKQIMCESYLVDLLHFAEIILVLLVASVVRAGRTTRSAWEGKKNCICRNWDLLHSFFVRTLFFRPMGWILLFFWRFWAENIFYFSWVIAYEFSVSKCIGVVNWSAGFLDLVACFAV